MFFWILAELMDAVITGTQKTTSDSWCPVALSSLGLPSWRVLLIIWRFVEHACGKQLMYWGKKDSGKGNVGLSIWIILQIDGHRGWSSVFLSVISHSMWVALRRKHTLVWSHLHKQMAHRGLQLTAPITMANEMGTLVIMGALGGYSNWLSWTITTPERTFFFCVCV